jgi:hypothetical protein
MTALMAKVIPTQTARLIEDEPHFGPITTAPGILTTIPDLTPYLTSWLTMERQNAQKSKAQKTVVFCKLGC